MKRSTLLAFVLGKRRLEANGILNPDGSINEETAKRMEWDMQPGGMRRFGRRHRARSHERPRIRRQTPFANGSAFIREEGRSEKAAGPVRGPRLYLRNERLGEVEESAGATGAASSTSRSLLRRRA